MPINEQYFVFNNVVQALVKCSQSHVSPHGQCNTQKHKVRHLKLCSFIADAEVTVATLKAVKKLE